jgi:branched-chain amino acid transport system ATP-binding protein
MLEIVELQVTYGDVPAVRNVSLRVGENELVALVGANAAGKSTVLNAISGIVPTRSGQIIFKGERIDNFPSHHIVERGIVQVPEGRRLFGYMSVLDNLLVAATNREAKAKRQQMLRKVFDLLPVLEERKDQMAGSLSGGEQQMCAIGRGLMACPEVMMLDEPSLGLAPLAVKKVFGIILEIRTQGTPILLVEQNVLESLTMADRGYVLENGTLVMSGQSRELLASKELRRTYLGL